MRMVSVDEGWGEEGEWPPVSMAAASGVALPEYVCECDRDAPCAKGSEEGRQSDTPIVVATLLCPLWLLREFSIRFQMAKVGTYN